mmetsp:Transcript_77871/g.208090  ORF Transcript_77871/g.208090 Transcript_77871/m.208090 type:complete len:593 (+) Transcript_77871:61-1839(+)
METGQTKLHSLMSRCFARALRSNSRELIALALALQTSLGVGSHGEESELGGIKFFRREQSGLAQKDRKFKARMVRRKLKGFAKIQACIRLTEQNQMDLKISENDREHHIFHLAAQVREMESKAAAARTDGEFASFATLHNFFSQEMTALKLQLEADHSEIEAVEKLVGEASKETFGTTLVPAVEALLTQRRQENEARLSQLQLGVAKAGKEGNLKRIQAPAGGEWDRVPDVPYKRRLAGAAMVTVASQTNPSGFLPIKMLYHGARVLDNIQAMMTIQLLRGEEVLVRVTLPEMPFPICHYTLLELIELPSNQLSMSSLEPLVVKKNVRAKAQKSTVKQFTSVANSAGRRRMSAVQAAAELNDAGLLGLGAEMAGLVEIEQTEAGWPWVVLTGQEVKREDPPKVTYSLGDECLEKDRIMLSGWIHVPQLVGTTAMPVLEVRLVECLQQTFGDNSTHAHINLYEVATGWQRWCSMRTRKVLRLMADQGWAEGRGASLRSVLKYFNENGGALPPALAKVVLDCFAEELTELKAELSGAAGVIEQGDMAEFTYHAPSPEFSFEGFSAAIASDGSIAFTTLFPPESESSGSSSDDDA